MTIRVYCHASCGNTLGMWGFNVEYFAEDGNKDNDIWNSDTEQVINTTLLQMQFMAILKSVLYLNSLTFALKPDTKDVLIHVPSKEIIKWLTNEYKTKEYPIDRSKPERLYRAYCLEIWAEIEPWNVSWVVIGQEIPKWLLMKHGWHVT